MECLHPHRAHGFVLRQMLSRHFLRDAFNSNVVSAAKENHARLGELITGRFDPDLDKGFPVFPDI